MSDVWSHPGVLHWPDDFGPLERGSVVSSDELEIRARNAREAWEQVPVSVYGWNLVASDNAGGGEFIYLFVRRNPS